MASEVRRQSNAWLRRVCVDIEGAVLSIGSGDDSDGQRGCYRDYFPRASSYTTSEVRPKGGCDLVLDVTNMPDIADAAYDCIYCSGVLEHVFDFRAGLDEMTRILKPGGVLLLGTPFRQGIHMKPNDFWRFTKFALLRLLEPNYEVVEMAELCPHDKKSWPVTYWTKATKHAV